ncbi:hypothetical protein L7F22_046754 [Adiantum nelumboides]|nr:hypothetical protein [Adiantum nelumboides]
MSSKKPKPAPKPSVSVASPVAAEPTRGTGKFYYRNGATYEGEWIFDANSEPLIPTPQSQDLTTPTDKPKGVRFKDGKGVYKDREYTYEGDWTKDLPNGEGCTFKFASGALYEGEWKMGAYCGNGTYKWPDGRCYSGDWRDNKMHGNGVYVDKDGHKWTGQFFNGSGPGLTCEL